MRGYAHGLLIIEILICFSPLVVGTFVSTVGLFMQLTRPEVPAPHLEHVLLTLFFVACLAAVFCMAHYLESGQRTMPRYLLLAIGLAGLAYTGWALSQNIESAEPVLIFLLGAPFLGGLHLLYLGRSYFTRPNMASDV